MIRQLEESLPTDGILRAIRQCMKTIPAASRRNPPLFVEEERPVFHFET
jgi:hypothetical protein